MTPTRDELLKLDTAFHEEIDRVSSVEYNSNEICRAFYQRLRERFADVLCAHQAQAEPAVLDFEKVSKAAQQANQQYGQWMPERWLQLFVAAYDKGE